MIELSPMETAVLFDRVAKKEAQMNEQSGRCVACNAPVDRPTKGMLSGVENGLCQVCNNDVNVLLVTRDMLGS